MHATAVYMARNTMKAGKMELHNIHLVILFFFLNLNSWRGGVVVYAQSNETDRLALLRFKELITNDPSGTLSSWNQSLHFCNWFGVRCSNQSQRVIRLDLVGYNLRGNLSPYIGNLTFLQVLNLAANDMFGQVPYEIGHLFRLQELTLANNSFGEKIPVTLSNCTKLIILDFTGNLVTGEIPPELGSLKYLQFYNFYGNKLIGSIPPSVGNLTALTRFSVGENNLEGNIPEEIGLMRSLYFFGLGANSFSGEVPSSIFNISSLGYISIPLNQLTGPLPVSMGLTLPNLEYFGIAVNQFTGSIPPSITNASMLRVFQIIGNNFTGRVPTNLGSLKHLENLALAQNNLGSNSSDDLSFIEPLTNCRKLLVLDFGSNNFGGILPNSISNLSTELIGLYMWTNNIYGNIPNTIGNLANLRTLSLSRNRFTGVIPKSIGNMSHMLGLYLRGNKLSGPIPNSIRNLTKLIEMILSENLLEGRIPPSIANLQAIKFLELSSNKLTGTIPRQLFELPSLSRFLNLSFNYFQGPLSADIGKLDKTNLIDISNNYFSGEIPSAISGCLSLEFLYMQDNSFQQSMPSTLAAMTWLQVLDLSRNNLTGQIPKDLSKVQFSYLNLSFNNLDGEVPTEGVFGNASAISVIGNSNLCGGIAELHLLSCLSVVRKKHGKSLALKLIVIIVPIVMCIVLLLSILFFYWARKSSKNSSSTQPTLDKLLMLSYKRLHQATEGFSAGKVIGVGGFGTVYKAFLDGDENMLVAVKVLKLDEKGASNSFITECKVLRNVRHRNLVKILTYCSSLDHKGNEFRALVFEFMENSSLDKWLHADTGSETTQKKLDFFQRLNIAIDVASAMHYLHDLCETTIIHFDLKPSNILLDDDMVAHVGDFGLAKLLFEDQTSITSTIAVRGSIGYIAPEYGMGGEASKSGDAYSYGILVLEMLTGRSPSAEMFNDDINLHKFVKNTLPKSFSQIVDPILLDTLVEDSNYKNQRMRDEIEKGLVLMLKVGVACSTELPRERMSMECVHIELQHIKKSILDFGHD